MNSQSNRHAMLIMAGSIGGQLIIIGSMPFLSRLYTPEEIGYFTTFTAITGLFATTSALHYELAIPLPKSDHQAFSIILIALSAVSISTVLLASIVYLAAPSLWGLAGIEELLPVRFLLPISLLLNGLFSVATLSAVRKQRHARNAAARLGQGAFQSVVQISGAVLGGDWRALIAGQLAGLAAAIMLLLPNGKSNKSKATPTISVTRLLAVAHKYRDLPFAATPSSLINSASLNVPPLLITAFFGLSIAGLYGLCLRVLQTPIRFVGQAIGQVFFRQAVLANNENRLSSITTNLFLVLLRFSAHTFIPFFFIAPSAFSAIFGSNWSEAGTYTRWLTPWLMLSFIATPLSILVTVLNQQRRELQLQIIYLIMVCASLLIGSALGNIVLAMASLGITGAIFLSAKLVWILRISKCSQKEIFKDSASELALSLAIHVWLLVPLGLGWANDIWITITGCIWIAATHLINYRLRRIYAF